MRVAGRVLSTKDIVAGGGVSYGYIHRAPHDSRLALITGGYAQGVVRALGSRASVEIAGVVHPIVGRIAMDVCVVDIGDAEVALGAEATYFGGRGPLAAGVAEWAKITGMTIGELVAVVGAADGACMGGMNGPVLRVDEAVLRGNIAAVAARVDPAVLMMVVKDDGYGLGAAWAAGVAVDGRRPNGLARTTSPTALRLREVIGAGPRPFAWVTSDDAEIAAALRADIDLGVGTLDYLRRVIEGAAAARTRARGVHLKVDTGLHRNGLSPAEWDRRRRAGAARPSRTGTSKLVGAWSHLAEASDAEDDAAQAVFLDAVQRARDLGAELPYVHLTASAATWARPELRGGTLVRVGAFCFVSRSADGPDLAGIAAGRRADRPGRAASRRRRRRDRHRILRRSAFSACRAGARRHLPALPQGSPR